MKKKLTIVIFTDLDGAIVIKIKFINIAYNIISLCSSHAPV